MKKSTKGAIAAGAAAVLLLGGAGSLAYWGDEASLPGGTITAGTLALDASTAPVWKLNNVAVPNNDLAEVLVVPGDVLTYEGAWTVEASGDNLEAELEFTGIAEDNASVANKMTVTTAYTLTPDGGSAAPMPAEAEITEDNDGDTISVSVTVDFPFGSSVDNTSQGMTLDLTGGALTLTQVQ